MSDNHHPYSIESLCAALGEAPPPPPPDGSTLRRKTQWMAGKSKAQRLAKKHQKQQRQQGPPITSACQGRDHGPLLHRVQLVSRPRRRNRSQVSRHAPLPIPPPVPLLSLNTTVTRGLRHLRPQPLLTRPYQDIFSSQDITDRESTIYKIPSPTSNPYLSSSPAQYQGPCAYDTAFAPVAQQPHKDPKFFDSPHTLKVRVWQEDFGYNIQVAYHDQKIQELGASLTKDEMEVAGILMSLSRPLPIGAAEQHQEKVARPPIWSKPVAMQAAVGIGLLGKAKEIKMPKPLGKIKVERMGKPIKSILKKR